MLDSVTKKLMELEQQQQADELELPANATPLDFLCAIFRDSKQPMARRQRAAEAAAVYMHPKLAVTATINGEAFGDALERAIKRSGKRIDRGGPLIEHQHQLPEAVEPR